MSKYVKGVVGEGGVAGEGVSGVSQRVGEGMCRGECREVAGEGASVKEVYGVVRRGRGMVTEGESRRISWSDGRGLVIVCRGECRGVAKVEGIVERGRGCREW